MTNRRLPASAGMEEDGTPRWFFAALLLIGLGAAAYVLLATSGGGIGTSPDAINFIAASKTLLAGEGYWRFTRVPFTSWPPLYPTFLAPLNLVGQMLRLDIVETIRYSNAVIMFLTAAAAGMLFRRYVRSPLLALAGTCLAVFALPVIRMSLFAWTEPLYILLTLLFIWLLPGYLQHPTIRLLIPLLLAATLGSLERFAGIGMIAGGAACILLFTPSLAWRKRLLHAGLMLACAAPWVLWLLYGMSLPRRAVIAQTEPLASLLRNLELTPTLLGEWFFSSQIHHDALALAGTLIAAAGLGCAVYAYYRTHRLRNEYPSAFQQPAFITAYVLAYMASFYAGHILVTTTIVDQRHLGVNLIIIYVVILWAVDRLRVVLKPRGFLITAAVLLYLAYPAAVIYKDVRELSPSFGIGNWHRQDPLLQWLAANPLPPGRQYSNTPLPLFYTPALVLGAPVELADWSGILDKHRDEAIYLIWFKDAETYIGIPGYYNNLKYTEDELAAAASVEKIVEVETGKILLIRHPS